MDTIDLVIDADGIISAVWDDALAGLVEGGEARIVRASHVEPYGSGWTADMGPSGGPVLFADGKAHWGDGQDGREGGTLYPSSGNMTPFKTRGEALEAERAWLREHRGL